MLKKQITLPCHFSDSEDCCLVYDTVHVLGGEVHFMMVSVVLNGRMIDK